MSDLPTVDPSQTVNNSSAAPLTVLALVVVWNADNPERSGEVFLLPSRGGPFVLGRSITDTDEAVALEPVRQRPGINQPAGALSNPALSRRQLRLRPARDGLLVDNIGRCSLAVNGRLVQESVTARPDDLLLLQSTLLLRVELRCQVLPETPSFPRRLWPAFGKVDALGLVGESPAMWQLREQIGFLASRRPHVLILGESGTGKELAAQAIHALSSRGSRPLISRNAANIPEGLVSAELFGSARNYPNAGMEARPGLIGEADGSSLFLDEIGEVSEEVQAHLLRVLDGGEYTRLGESRSRTADLRLITATNRPPRTLKHDMLARLILRLRMPSLNERLSDVPLLLLHLLHRETRDDPALKRKICDASGTPRISSQLILALVGHRYTTHVRELMQLMWSSCASSDGRLKLTGSVRDELASTGTSTDAPATAVKPEALSPAHVQAVLDKHGGSKEEARKELGLANRWQLYRFIKKHGLTVNKK